jgi:GTPase SAR1 family protein
MGSASSSSAEKSTDILAPAPPGTKQILMIGLKKSGKTSILYQMKDKEFVQALPTKEYNVESFDYANNKLKVWDFGGGYKMHDFWKFYAEQVKYVVFVVDSTDKKKLYRQDFSSGNDSSSTQSTLSAAEEIEYLYSNGNLAGTILLVFANKQDLKSTAMSVEEIAVHLGLKNFRHIIWHVQPCSALNGEGISDGLDWLIEAMQSI